MSDHGDPNDLGALRTALESVVPAEKFQEISELLMLVIGQVHLNGSRWAVSLFRQAASTSTDVEELRHFADKLNWSLDLRAAKLTRRSAEDEFENAVQKLIKDAEEK